jgi:phage terminase large subunit
LAVLAERVGTAIQNDPVTFCRNVLGFHPWSKQSEIIESVRDFPRTAVRSCHGSGKTATAARVVAWFLTAYPGSRVITTAPTFSQVRDLLWSEINGAVARAPEGLFPACDTTRLTISREWFAVGLSTDRPERFQGHHAEHLLLVVDEASGVHEDIYEAAEGFLTSPGARVLLIGNPTQTSGTFYRAFHSERDLYNTIHISAYDTPNLTGEEVPEAVRKSLVSPEWVEQRREQWGEGPLWDVRVLGNFPSESEDQVIGLQAVEDARKRTVEPGRELVISCDVARYGSDETVIVIRQGQRVRLHKSYTSRSLMETVGEIVDAARQYNSSNLRVVVDDVGLGGGVTDRLKELGVPVSGFNGGSAANEPRLYPNRRSEAWFAFADQIKNIDLDTDEQLGADLVSPKYALDSAGRRVVEPKDKTKRRLGRSPDRADAVLMAFAPAPRMGASFDVDIWSL